METCQVGSTAPQPLLSGLCQACPGRPAPHLARLAPATSITPGLKLCGGSGGSIIRAARAQGKLPGHQAGAKARMQGLRGSGRPDWWGGSAGTGGSRRAALAQPCGRSRDSQEPGGKVARGAAKGKPHGRDLPRWPCPLLAGHGPAARAPALSPRWSKVQTASRPLLPGPGATH